MCQLKSSILMLLTGRPRDIETIISPNGRTIQRLQNKDHTYGSLDVN